MIELDTRKLLEKSFRPGQRASAVVLRLLERARDEVLFYQTNGHRAPKETSFEWSD